LGGVPVELFDAALGVFAVAAHVKLAVCAGAARHGVGTAHHADHQIAGGEAAVRRRLADPAQRLVTEDQPLPFRCRPAILTARDLLVGAAHPNRERVDEQVSLARLGVGHVRHGQRVLLQWDDGQGTHRRSPPLVDVPGHGASMHRARHRPRHRAAATST
jgi:hypothetical protein